MKDKTAKNLWQDYRFLTREMLKFLTKDTNLFYKLMDQRQKLQLLIEQTPDDGFRASPEGKTLIAEILEASQLIQDNLRGKMGKRKRQQQITQAYNSVSTTAVSRMNYRR